MIATSDPEALFQQFLRADEELGLKLELTAGWPTWEFAPSVRHQRLIDRIRASIKPAPKTGSHSGGGCVHLADVYIQFADGSLKRPDIALFCQPPPEVDTALTLVPEAVIEIISRGSEDKDLTLNPPFYLAQGVKDVLVVDPYTTEAWHFRRDGKTRGALPYKATLKCGCRCVLG